MAALVHLNESPLRRRVLIAHDVGVSDDQIVHSAVHIDETRVLQIAAMLLHAQPVDEHIADVRLHIGLNVIMGIIAKIEQRPRVIGRAVRNISADNRVDVRPNAEQKRGRIAVFAGAQIDVFKIERAVIAVIFRISKPVIDVKAHAGAFAIAVAHGYAIQPSLFARKHPHALIGALKRQTVDQHVGDVGHAVMLVGRKGNKIVAGASVDIADIQEATRPPEMQAVLIVRRIVIAQIKMHVLDIDVFEVAYEHCPRGIILYGDIANRDILNAGQLDGDVGALIARMRVQHDAMPVGILLRHRRAMAMMRVVVVVGSADQRDVALRPLAAAQAVMRRAQHRPGNIVAHEQAAVRIRTFNDRIGMDFQPANARRAVQYQVQMPPFERLIERSLQYFGIVVAAARMHVGVQPCARLAGVKDKAFRYQSLHFPSSIYRYYIITEHGCQFKIRRSGIASSTSGRVIGLAVSPEMG